MELDNNGKWIKAYCKGMKSLAKQKLTTREYKLVLYLMSVLNDNNILLILNQTALAKELKIAQPHISAILKSLEEKGIIIKKNGHTFLNSEYCIFGNRNKDISLKEDDLYTQEEKDLFN